MGMIIGKETAKHSVVIIRMNCIAKEFGLVEHQPIMIDPCSTSQRSSSLLVCIQ